MEVILASGSPRRKELLSLITKNFKIIISNTDENFKEGLTIEEQSKRIAYLKSKAVFDKTEGNRIVIGSDTMVIKDGKFYGKPKDKKEAFQMITELQNNVHEVITSICILIEKDGKIEKYNDYDISKVHISAMSSEEIKRWIDTGKAMDKAGAYAIQEEFSKFIERIDGNYDSIVGLPTHKVYQILKPYIN